LKKIKELVKNKPMVLFLSSHLLFVNSDVIAMVLSVTDEEEIERRILAYSPKFQGMIKWPTGKSRKN